MYEIVGCYKGCRPEVVDTASDEGEAIYLLGEYRIAYGPKWTLNYRRVRK
jgi:hypothetical protein